MRRVIRTIVTLGLVVPLTFLATAPARAEKNDAGSWLAIAGMGDFEPLVDSKRPLWWLDAQLRLLDDSNGYDQALIRPGLGWDVGAGFSVWAGYAYIHTDPRHRSDFDEHRPWQQLLWSGPVGDLGLQIRTRLEERYVDGDGETGWRFRQFVKASYALPFAPRLGLASYEEVFFDLNDTNWGANTGFSQNRFFAGASAKLSEARKIVVELGYLNQYIRRDGGEDDVNHIVNVNLILDFR
jgi:hypothetical protein